MQEAHATTLLLPASALRVLDLLDQGGFEAWAVGGFVRDSLLGRPTHDVDIATNAHWQQVAELAETAGLHTVETGVAHGTITVLCNDDAIEVTTYRVERGYTDARHPDEVDFVDSIEADLARRDFTVNAIAYHPARGMFDPFDGAADARSGVLRAVGDADERFDEDALRILRAVRFASELGFAVEPATLDAARRHAERLERVSAERIAAELDRLLCGQNALQVLMEQAEIVDTVLSELAPMRGFDQRTPYHCFDVMEHTAHTVAHTPAAPLLRWAALLHDIGKPETFFADEEGRGHFYGHPKASARIAQEVMERLKYPKRFASRVVTLVRYHDRPVPVDHKGVRKMLRILEGDEELFRELCALKRADGLAHAPDHLLGAQIADQLEQILDEVLAQESAFSLAHLAISGDDVLALGVETGPQVGAILTAALDAVIEGTVENERDELLSFARALAQDPERP